jgi:hypothetical protein
MDEQPDWLAEVAKDLAAEPEVEPYYPGVDPDGKERHPPFGLRFVAPDTAMQGVRRPTDEPEREFPPGAVQRSPFV